MSSLFKKIFKYGYHDTVLSSISIQNNHFVLAFEEGVYFLNKEKKEHRLTGSKRFSVVINNLFEDNVLSCFEVWKIADKRQNFISPKAFLCKTKKHNLEVNNVYFSDFNNTILLFTGKNRNIYLIMIANCVDFVEEKN